MDEIEKSYKKQAFPPPFPHFPSFSPLRQGKKSNLITEPIIQIIISLTFKDKKDMPPDNYYQLTITINRQQNILNPTTKIQTAP